MEMGSVTAKARAFKALEQTVQAFASPAVACQSKRHPLDCRNDILGPPPHNPPQCPQRVNGVILGDSILYAM